MAYLHRLRWLCLGLLLGALSVSAFAQQSPTVTYGACGFKGYSSPGGACSAAASALCGQYSKWCQGASLTSNNSYCSPNAGGAGCTINTNSVCPLGYNKIGGLCYPSSGGGTTQPPSGSTCTAGEVNSNPGGTLKETTSYCAPVSESTSCSTTVDWYTQPDGSVAGHIKRTGTTCTEEPPTGECTPQSSNFLGYLDDQPFCGPSSGTNPDADPDPDPDPDPTPDPGTDPGGGPGPGGTVSPSGPGGTVTCDPAVTSCSIYGGTPENPCGTMAGCKNPSGGQCPEGYLLNSTMNVCLFAGSDGCPDGKRWDYFYNKCVASASNLPDDPEAPGTGEEPSAPGVTSSFGGSCAQVESFDCKGDAVACATALAVARTECALKTSAGVVSQYEAMAAFDGTGDGEGLDKKIIDVEGMLNPSVQGGGSGLQDLTVDVLGQPITIPFSKLNLYLQMIGYAVMAIAWLSAFKIIAGAF